MEDALPVATTVLQFQDSAPGHPQTCAWLTQERIEQIFPNDPIVHRVLETIVKLDLMTNAEIGIEHGLSADQVRHAKRRIRRRIERILDASQL